QLPPNHPNTSPLTPDLTKGKQPANRRHRKYTAQPATRLPRPPQSVGPWGEFVALGQCGLGYKRQPARAPAATTPRQLPPGLGRKQAPRKPSAPGRARCGASAPQAVPGEVVRTISEDGG